MLTRSHLIAGLLYAGWLAEELEDAQALAAARAVRSAGEPVVPWEQVKREAGLA